MSETKTCSYIIPKGQGTGAKCEKKCVNNTNWCVTHSGCLEHYFNGTPRVEICGGPRMPGCFYCKYHLKQ